MLAPMSSSDRGDAASRPASIGLGVWLVVLGCLAIGGIPAPVSAQQSDTGTSGFVFSSGADEDARVVFQAGREAYARGDYESALEAFRQAYEMSNRPELLFNIGQTADRLRRDREARDAFDAYLENVPDAANRVEVEARLRVLREDIARDDALRAQAASSPSEPPLVEQWWFWTLIGVAVAGAGVGIGFAVGSREELAPPTPGDVVVIALELP